MQVKNLVRRTGFFKLDFSKIKCRWIGVCWLLLCHMCSSPIFVSRIAESFFSIKLGSRIFILDAVICSNTLGQNLSKPARIWRALKTSSQYIDMQQLSKLPLSQISLNMIRAIAESHILSTVLKTFIFLGN